MYAKRVIILIGLSYTFSLFAVLNDEAAFAYCLKHKNTYVVTLWPNVESTRSVHFIEQGLRLIGKIIAKKSFILKNNGPFLFITKVYAKEQDRTGNAADNYRLARVKEKQSFMGGAPVRSYLLQTNDLEKLLDYKYALRSKYNLDCLHIPDTHAESVSLAKLIFSTAVAELNKAPMI